MYISKDFINHSNNYYENNYKLELDLVDDSENFIQKLDDIMTFEKNLCDNFTQYAHDGIKCNLIEMLITPKTSKLCKFMLLHIKNIISIISCNEKAFYKNNIEINICMRQN